MALNRSESARTPLVHLWNGVGDNSLVEQLAARHDRPPYENSEQ